MPLRFCHASRINCGRGYSGKALVGLTSLAQRVIKGPLAGCQFAGLKFEAAWPKAQIFASATTKNDANSFRFISSMLRKKIRPTIRERVNNIRNCVTDQVRRRTKTALVCGTNRRTTPSFTASFSGDFGVHLPLAETFAPAKVN